jgi:hypothetical protein
MSFGSTLPLFKKLCKTFGSTFSKGGKRWKKVEKGLKNIMP